VLLPDYLKVPYNETSDKGQQKDSDTIDPTRSKGEVSSEATKDRETYLDVSRWTRMVTRT